MNWTDYIFQDYDIENTNTEKNTPPVHHIKLKTDPNDQKVKLTFIHCPSFKV